MKKLGGVEIIEDTVDTAVRERPGSANHQIFRKAVIEFGIAA